MCGIAGRFARHQAGTDVVDRMVERMSHRGPDDSQVWLAPQICLGHCRLAVIDPDNAQQPMLTQDRRGRRAIVTFGGEIYNHQELRRRLSSAGYKFTTGSDTEVIGAGYLEWGVDAFRLFRGMFAIGIWDEHLQRLVLCRDQLGIKPLFFSENPESFLFASEQGALAEALGRFQIDEVGVSELLGLWPYSTPGVATLRGIDELAAGHYMVISSEGTKTSRYWELIAHEHRDSFAETTEVVRSLVTESVTEQLSSDAPLTLLLSGGLDSSVVATIASDHWIRPEPFSAHTLELPESDEMFRPTTFRHDLDGPFARMMADYSNASLERVLLTDADIIGEESTTTKARDMPDNADMDTTLLRLFRAVRDKYKVCLTGEGADEIFGGYPWYMQEGQHSLDETYPWTRYLSFPLELVVAELQQTVAEYRRSRVDETLAQIPFDRTAVSPQEWRGRLTSYLDLKVFLPGQLERMDRISMSQGIEARVPFCTPELAIYCWNVPESMKKRGGAEKGLLREAFSKSLPVEISSRRKTSYPTSAGRVYEDHLRRTVDRAIRDDDWAFAGILDRELVRQTLDGHRNPPSTRPSIWLGQISSLYRWAKEYDVEYVR